MLSRLLLNFLVSTPLLQFVPTSEWGWAFGLEPSASTQDTTTTHAETLALRTYNIPTLPVTLPLDFMSSPADLLQSSTKIIGKS